MARLLGTEHQKSEEAHGEQISDSYLDYARNDVQVTWECWQELKARYERFGLPPPPWKVHSEASIGKAHLNKIELDPFRVLNDWSPHVLAAVMETYYGGRAECSIRRVAMPGVYLDFASQYPTVFVLQGLQRFLTAQRVAFHEQDPQHAQDLLENVTVEHVVGKDLWRDELTALALVAPDGDRLPTRARYNARQPRRDGKHKSGSYNVGVPYRYGGPPQWYTLADCAASTLMTGKAPRILKVLRFTTDGTQPNLQPINVAGDAHYRVDPREQDFIARLVEMRADAKTHSKRALGDGEAERAAFLDSSQQAMKATANATSYGSAIELNPVEHRKGAWVTIHLPDGSSHRAKNDRTEEPGKWFHPLIATLVSAGGRLLLATAMRLIEDRGGSHVFCDTDGIFVAATEHGHLIPCPGGPHQTNEGLAAVRALSWPQVQRVVDRFTPLDPYTGKGHPQSILKIEEENYDPDTGRQRRIECWAIAAKRYGIFVRRSDGAPLVIGSGDKRKRSEHGLGHLLPPYARSPDLSDRAWLDEWWEHLLHLELGFLDHPEPAWFNAPAVGRVSVTSQRDLKTFAAYNDGKPYTAQVKPWGFLILAHPTPVERARANGPRTLIAPFERDPTLRVQMRWTDRDRPDQPPTRIYTSTAPTLRSDATAVLSYRDYFSQYRQHPESKALDPTDGRPCHTWTPGLLCPWEVHASEYVRVGKESNR